jgi:hypothetical protein
MHAFLSTVALFVLDVADNLDRGNHVPAFWTKATVNYADAVGSVHMIGSLRIIMDS